MHDLIRKLFLASEPFVGSLLVIFPFLGNSFFQTVMFEANDWII